MGQGIGTIVVVVVAVHIVKEASRMLAQGIIQEHKRLAAAPAMGFGLLAHLVHPAAIDLARTPGGLREKAGSPGMAVVAY
jgi:hypothetical protein